MNARALVPHRTFFLPGQRRTEPAAQTPEPAPTTDLRARLAARRTTVRELAEALREHSLVAELVASAPAA